LLLILRNDHRASAVYLPFEFAAFWAEQFRKLEAFGEINFINNLKAHMTDNVFNSRAHSMIHRIFTVVLVVAGSPGIVDVQRRYLMRSQSEAMFLCA
jgi:hypothetical protein